MKHTNAPAPTIGAPFLLSIYSDAIGITFQTVEQTKAEIFSYEIATAESRDGAAKIRLSAKVWEEDTARQIFDFFAENPKFERLQIIGAAIELPENWAPVYDKAGLFFGTYQRPKEGAQPSKAPQPPRADVITRAATAATHEERAQIWEQEAKEQAEQNPIKASNARECAKHLRRIIARATQDFAEVMKDTNATDEEKSWARRNLHKARRRVIKRSRAPTEHYTIRKITHFAEFCYTDCSMKNKSPIQLLRGRYTTMIARCHNPNAHAFDRYGGRGIEVCPRWRESFANFFADMGLPPKGASLDRIDNDGPYSPENCIWATRNQQARNKRTNVLIAIDGKSRCIAEWAEIAGICQQTIRRRMERGESGLDLIRPLSYPFTQITIADETHSIAEWATLSGLSDSAIRGRIKNGLTGIDLIKQPHKGPRKNRATLPTSVTI